MHVICICYCLSVCQPLCSLMVDAAVCILLIAEMISIITYVHGGPLHCRLISRAPSGAAKSIRLTVSPYYRPIDFAGPKKQCFGNNSASNPNQLGPNMADVHNQGATSTTFRKFWLRSATWGKCKSGLERVTRSRRFLSQNPDDISSNSHQPILPN